MHVSSVVQFYELEFSFLKELRKNSQQFDQQNGWDEYARTCLSNSNPNCLTKFLFYKNQLEKILIQEML